MTNLLKKMGIYKCSNNKFRWLWTMIQEVVEYTLPNYIITDWIHILEYKQGYYFDKHTDIVKGYHTREYSGGIELNDNWEGGEFLIEGKKLNTKIGKLFYFKPDLIHELRPITKGIRYSLHFPLNKKEKNII